MTAGFWIILIGSMMNVFFGLWRYGMITAAGNAALFQVQRDGYITSTSQAMNDINSMLGLGGMPNAVLEPSSETTFPSPMPSYPVVLSNSQNPNSPTPFGSTITLDIGYYYNFNVIGFLPAAYVNLTWQSQILSEYYQ